MNRTVARASVALGLSVGLVAPMAVAALAAAVDPGVARSGRLTQVGPVAEHGFPAWYRDSNGVRLEACTTLDDPLCSTLPDEVPNPDAPVSYPDNFPGEFFYQLAGAEVPLSTGAVASIGLDLEGAWAAEEVVEGDQMVFGRVRIRFDAPAGEKYRIVHPYGVDEIVADDRGVNMTQDIGTTPGAFGGAFNSRIGPFLRWDPAVAPAAPAGYTGDPGVDHKVVGSPYNTNFVTVQRIDPTTGAALAELGRTDLFSVQGRYATNAGVDIDQATYTVGADGTGVVEVYASSEPGQSIEIVGNPALGYHNTRLRALGGRYYGRFPVTGQVAADATVEIVNASDRPVTRKTRKLVDVVTVSRATYHADTRRLVVNAQSSDDDSTPGQLTLVGFGPVPAGFNQVTAPPATVTVTSSSGGSTTVPVVGSGQAFLPAAPVAAGFAVDQAVIGQKVALDGTGSTGEITGFQWRQTAGPATALTGETAATAQFQPTAEGSYTFELVVTGPGGASQPTTVTVVVVAARPMVADAGADQTVIRGRAVTLDGSKTVGAETYAWTQVSGPTATLTGAGGAKLTFTYPLHALPAAPGPNAGFVHDNAPLVFRLTTSGPGGTASDDVTVSPQPESITGVTARYRTRGEWRISGTSSLAAGQRITVVLGGTLTGQVIGTATVGAAGAFSLVATRPAPGTVRTISMVSTTGGRILGAPLTVTG